MAAQGDEPVTPSQPIQLFNGLDLKPFYSWLVDDGREDLSRVFSVVAEVDGAPALRISGEKWGGLITRRSYRDYRLTVEFRWGLISWGNRKKAARDSGVLVHCQAPDGNTASDFNGPWMRSIEAQIIQGGVGDFILVAGFGLDGARTLPTLAVATSRDRDGEPVYDPEGPAQVFKGVRINWYGRDPDWRDELDFRGRRDVESRVDEWTRLEVICDRDRITNVVNGTVVNRGLQSSLTSGKILFQSEGAEIYFRRIELKPLR